MYIWDWFKQYYQRMNYLPRYFDIYILLLPNTTLGPVRIVGIKVRNIKKDFNNEQEATWWL